LLFIPRPEHFKAKAKSSRSGPRPENGKAKAKIFALKANPKAKD